MRSESGFFSILIVSLLLSVNSSISLGKVIYVDDDALSPGDGMSWASAYRFLQDALTDAATAEKPVEIRVAQGTYKPNRNAENPEGNGGYPWDLFFRLDDGMSLLGGYAGVSADDPNTRDFEVYETVLSGDLAGNDAEVTDAALLRTDPTRDENTWEVLEIYGEQVRLGGCTITGGTAGSVKVSGSNVTISDCLFRGNRGNEVDAQASAGGLTAYGTNQLIVRCSFIGNAGHKGAARADGESFEDCLFSGNYGWGFGGGAGWHYGGTFTDCIFVNNRARNSGGALYFQGGCTLTRCVFRGNVAGMGGGIGLSRSRDHHRLSVRRK